MDCIFCNRDNEIRRYAPYWFVRLDRFPVTQSHREIIPLRHIGSLDQLTPEEWSALLPVIKAEVTGKFAPDYNLGINCGPAAGQTIPHLHIHIFPRQTGDVENPRGGIRNFKKPLVEY